MGGEVWRQAQLRVCRCSKQANGPLGRQWQRHCCCTHACPSPPLHLSSSSAPTAPAAWWSGPHGRAGSQRWGRSSRAAAAASARLHRHWSGCQWCCAGGGWAAGWCRFRSARPPACKALEQGMQRTAAGAASQLLCCAVLRCAVLCCAVLCCALTGTSPGRCPGRSRSCRWQRGGRGQDQSGQKQNCRPQHSHAAS